MRHEFVDFIPSELEENVLYISIEYDIAKHKCACGCGADIVTSLSPARWKLTYDGETVSLYPSIGNWTHKCKSHYFITNNKVIWAEKMSELAIRNVIKNDQVAVKRYIKSSIKKENKLIKWLKKRLK
ncbi:DUF6527 family protein [Falsibacillus pallidus]|uniref:Uncharacterized protein n=1 Tax=Falsibacillus pallidus TaxID=493781 RepID=A0A370G1B3_9BACI|nr:DUF6527 family protein [Falsibacillus pallidus]RDI37532.1 hypothetical protein DFR59_12129 [Falsibacillus pallidus]